MNEEYEEIIDFEEPNNEAEKEFSLVISETNEQNNLSGEKSPTKSNKAPVNLLDILEKEDNVLSKERDSERGDLAKEVYNDNDNKIKNELKYKEYKDHKEYGDYKSSKEFSRKKDKRSDNKSSSDRSKSKEKKDALNSNNKAKDKKPNAYYFILKFPGETALNTCLDNNFIILSPNLSEFQDVIENSPNVYFFFVTSNKEHVFIFVKKKDNPVFDEKLNSKILYFEKRHKIGLPYDDVKNYKEFSKFDFGFEQEILLLSVIEGEKLRELMRKQAKNISSQFDEKNIHSVTSTSKGYDIPQTQSHSSQFGPMPGFPPYLPMSLYPESKKYSQSGESGGKNKGSKSYSKSRSKSRSRHRYRHRGKDRYKHSSRSKKNKRSQSNSISRSDSRSRSKSTSNKKRSNSKEKNKASSYYKASKSSIYGIDPYVQGYTSNKSSSKNLDERNYYYSMPYQGSSQGIHSMGLQQGQNADKNLPYYFNQNMYPHNPINPSFSDPKNPSSKTNSEDLRYHGYSTSGYYGQYSTFSSQNYSQHQGQGNDSKELQYPDLNMNFLRHPMPWMPSHHMGKDRHNEDKYDRININNINFIKNTRKEGDRRKRRRHYSSSSSSDSSSSNSSRKSKGRERDRSRGRERDRSKRNSDNRSGYKKDKNQLGFTGKPEALDTKVSGGFSSKADKVEVDDASKEILISKKESDGNLLAGLEKRESKLSNFSNDPTKEKENANSKVNESAKNSYKDNKDPNGSNSRSNQQYDSSGYRQRHHNYSNAYHTLDDQNNDYYNSHSQYYNKHDNRNSHGYGDSDKYYNYKRDKYDNASSKESGYHQAHSSSRDHDSKPQKFDFYKHSDYEKSKREQQRKQYEKQQQQANYQQQPLYDDYGRDSSKKYERYAKYNSTEDTEARNTTKNQEPSGFSSSININEPKKSSVSDTYPTEYEKTRVTTYHADSNEYNTQFKSSIFAESKKSAEETNLESSTKKPNYDQNNLTKDNREIERDQEEREGKYKKQNNSHYYSYNKDKDYGDYRRKNDNYNYKKGTFGGYKERNREGQGVEIEKDSKNEIEFDEETGLKYPASQSAVSVKEQESKPFQKEEKFSTIVNKNKQIVSDASPSTGKGHGEMIGLGDNSGKSKGDENVTFIGNLKLTKRKNDDNSSKFTNESYDANKGRIDNDNRRYNNKRSGYNNRAFNDRAGYENDNDNNYFSNEKDTANNFVSSSYQNEVEYQNTKEDGEIEENSKGFKIVNVSGKKQIIMANKRKTNEIVIKRKDENKPTPDNC